MKTDNAKQQDAPNNNEAAKQQDGPIYGPPTEKEHLRAIKHDAEKHLEAAYDKYKAAKDALPPEPSKKESENAFARWLEANHRAAYDYEQKRISFDERQSHQRKVIEPLFAVWCASEEGRQIGGPRLVWERASEAIEADYKTTRAPHEAAIAEAKERWDKIQEEEQRKRRTQERIWQKMEELSDEIGSELTSLDEDHADFDKEAFARFKEWHFYDEERRVFLNAILHGAPGSGKSRAMAHWATQERNIDSYGEYAWITGSQYAELISALGDNEQRAEAKKTLRRLAEVEGLYFDDLGSAHFTPARISHFFALMDARYRARGYTIFTTNHGLKEIRSMLCGSIGKDDTTMADRILRRMVGTPNDQRATFFAFKRRKAQTPKGGKAAPVC
jgi:DNA replication protein DnaC